jgi:hypothetical protein
LIADPIDVFAGRRFAANLPSKLLHGGSFALPKLFEMEIFYEPQSSSCTAMTAKHARMRK